MGASSRDPSDARVSSREALRFLTRAGRLLSASLDPEETLERLVRLAVPRVACFAMIDLVRPAARLERVAYRHVDEAREPLLERPDPFLPEEEGLLPLARVLETAEAVLIENVEQDWSGGEGVLERIRSLAGRSLMLVPLLAGDEVLGVLTFGSTRTDRFYHQQDLTLARELARSASLAMENARLYRKAEQAIAARDEVLGVVSHDLRNPVNRVRLAAELMRESYELPEGAERAAAMIVRATAEMNRLIGDLLDVSRIEAGRLSVDAGATPLETLLGRLEEAHAPAASEKGLVWNVERPAAPSTLEIDEGRILQALGNLVGNAIKFTPEGGTVRVVVERTSDVVRMGVRDTGPGMDEAQLAHVFDRFWQSRAGDRRGAGLGLAIARGIIEAHGGRLHMDSRLGVGTTAWVELPLRGPAPGIDFAARR
jgi:signal transduction histidine kinase